MLLKIDSDMGNKSSFRIPGISFSLKRAFGITRAKQTFSKKTGIPTSRNGLERKIGSVILKKIFG